MDIDEIRGIVKKTRIRNGYSRKALAELIGTTETTIARFESGKTSCGIDLVIKIFNELGMEFVVTC